MERAVLEVPQGEEELEPELEHEKPEKTEKLEPAPELLGHGWAAPDLDADRSPGPPPAVDDIRMISCIAKGTSGSVYKAKWQGMPVAVKQFHIGNDDDEATLAFHNEIHLMKHLNHVNLVRFYAVRYPIPPRPTHAAAPY